VVADGPKASLTRISAAQGDSMSNHGGAASSMGGPRRVRVQGRTGVDATVIVTTVRDTVWLSISPPLTWEAIMNPEKVDEVISTLELARDEAKKMAAGCVATTPATHRDRPPHT
jgi:hypothetical protein